MSPGLRSFPLCALVFLLVAACGDDDDGGAASAGGGSSTGGSSTGGSSTGGSSTGGAANAGTSTGGAAGGGGDGLTMCGDASDVVFTSVTLQDGSDELCEPLTPEELNEDDGGDVGEDDCTLTEVGACSGTLTCGVDEDGVVGTSTATFSGDTSLLTGTLTVTITDPISLTCAYSFEATPM